MTSQCNGSGPTFWLYGLFAIEARICSDCLAAMLRKISFQFVDGFK
jgi:hypothetical protein